MVELKEYIAFLSVVARGDEDYSIRDHREGEAQVLVKGYSDKWWEIYIPDAGSIEAAVSLAETLTAEARKKYDFELKQERDNEERW